MTIGSNEGMHLHLPFHGLILLHVAQAWMVTLRPKRHHHGLPVRVHAGEPGSRRQAALYRQLPVAGWGCPCLPLCVRPTCFWVRVPPPTLLLPTACRCCRPAGFFQAYQANEAVNQVLGRIAGIVGGFSPGAGLRVYVTGGRRRHHSSCSGRWGCHGLSMVVQLSRWPPRTRHATPHTGTRSAHHPHRPSLTALLRCVFGRCRAQPGRRAGGACGAGPGPNLPAGRHHLLHLWGAQGGARLRRPQRRVAKCRPLPRPWQEAEPRGAGGARSCPASTRGGAAASCLASCRHPAQCGGSPPRLSLPLLLRLLLQVGNRAFAGEFRKLVPDSWAVVNDQDPVARVPATGGWVAGRRRLLLLLRCVAVHRSPLPPSTSCCACGSWGVQQAPGRGAAWCCL